MNLRLQQIVLPLAEFTLTVNADRVHVFSTTTGERLS